MMNDFQKLLNVQVDGVSVDGRCRKFTNRSIKKESKINALEQIIKMIDLTTLEGDDSSGRVARLCQKAQQPMVGAPSVAAVCLYPKMIPEAVRILENSTVKVASVATAFPAGQASMDVRLLDLEQALSNGADEIDMVISRGDWLSGDEQMIADEIAAFKAVCGSKHLKVILETGELGTLTNVRRASLTAIAAGADFIKTSTGKIPQAASLATTLVMLEAARDWHDLSGQQVGVKAAGGIRTAKEAISYLVMVLETVGPDWINPQLFRFGASSLLNDLLRQLHKQQTGVYQGEDYLSLA